MPHSNTVHLFNPDYKYGLERMRTQARKALDRKDQTTIIHMHSDDDTSCAGWGCETYEPEGSPDA